MTEIILVRHGETDWNKERIFRGRTDIPLNETGLRQARRLARYLAQKKIDAVCSSPLVRALRTAEIIARPHNLAGEINPDLIDFNYGEWQGLTYTEVQEKYGELYRDWLTNPHLVTMPGGENLDAVRMRALWVVQNVARLYPEGTVVIVSHEVVLKVIIYTLLGLDHSHFWDIRLDNCGVTTFLKEDDRCILASHNETSFLRTSEKRNQGTLKKRNRNRRTLSPYQPTLL